MAYSTSLAAALSGATPGQLAYWRSRANGREPLLEPALAVRPKALYSYEDVVALRIFTRLRDEVSLQRIRKAVEWLRQSHPCTHLSAHALRATVGGQSIVWISSDGDYFDIVERPGQTGIQVVMQDVFASYKTRDGARVPKLANPAPGISVDRDVRGGYPVLRGTRIPFHVIAGLAQDGLGVDQISKLYPSVKPVHLRGALKLAGSVGSDIDAQAS